MKVSVCALSYSRMHTETTVAIMYQDITTERQCRVVINAASTISHVTHDDGQSRRESGTMVS